LACIQRMLRFLKANQQRKTASGYPSAVQAERNDPHDAPRG
jgi:hypothetical protein